MSTKEKAQAELDAEFEAEKVKLAKKALQGIQGNENNIKMLQEENEALTKYIGDVENATTRIELNNVQNSISIRSMRGYDRD
jgi:hypothetical protein